MANAVVQYDVFLSCPMAGVNSDARYQEVRKEALRVAKCLEKECRFRVFFAGRDVMSKSRFDADFDYSLAQDIRTLEESRYFLLYYPERIVSSVLVEAGMALALKKPALYFVRNRMHLPFMLQRAESLASVKVCEFKTTNRLLTIIRDYKKDLFERWPSDGLVINRSTEDLTTLRDDILDLYEYCNKFCSVITIDKSPLFNPSQSAHSNLFVRLMPTPVHSETDFDRFVQALYLVFDERLRNDIRHPNSGRQLPNLLSEVRHVLHGGSFTDLGTLRNKFSPAHDNKESAWEILPIYQRLIGVNKPIASNDSANWQQLQKAVLRMVQDVLKNLKAIFQASEKTTYE